MKLLLTKQLPFLLLLVMVGLAACKKEETPEVISGFSFQVDPANFKRVTFTNAAQNYKSLLWEFGDGTTSTEDNPAHVYAAVGNYTVTLTATGQDGLTDVSSQVVGIVDPDAELTKLVGDVSKTWKLLRVVGPGRWPLEVGPISKTQVWWAQGRDNDEIARRPCIMNDEWTFGRDGSMKYRSNGDYWAEGGVFEPRDICAPSTPDNMKGPNGEDLSAFGDGDHTFVLTNGAKPTLEVKGLGAFVGLCKIGTEYEVKVPQQSVKLDILKLHDGTVDTLILESKWKFNTSSTSPDAYWKITLVHYDNPAEEPALPSPKPEAAFSTEVDGLSVTFTNTSKYADSYSWDFGDGATSSAKDPSHTYAASGLYTVKLTATNSVGTDEETKEVTVTTGAMTEADLVGAAWKIRVAENSIVVGPGLGNGSWWQVPLGSLSGSGTGGDDWSCMTNDEFIFTAGGAYEYKTNGDARNDGYFGTSKGCWSDADVAAAGANAAAFLSSTHTWAFTPADQSPSGRPIITLTNGTGAAFIGFYKGYYGGENSNGSNPPNGGSSTNRYEVISYVKSGSVETLTVSVDISTNKDGSAAWTMVLVR